MSEVGNALFEVARLALLAGQYAEAEKALDQTEQIALRDFGPNHINYATVLQMRAKLEREQGRPRDALPLLGHALEILRSIPECPDYMLAAVLNNAGFAQQAVGQYREAEKCFVEAKDLTRNSTNRRGQECYTSTLANLAELFNEIGQDERAAPLLVEALAIDRKLYPPTHPALATSIHNMGVFLIRHGEEREGAQLLKQAREIVEASFGTQSAQYARELSIMATALRQARMYEQAEVHCVFALETLRKSRPEKSPEIAGMLADLALIYACRGKFGQAEGALRKAVGINEATLPGDHQKDIETRFSLFSVLAAQGKTSDAFPVLRDAIAAESSAMDTILRLGSEKDRLAYLASLQWHVDAGIAFVVQCGMAKQEMVEWAFELILRRRGLTAEALAVQRDVVRAGANVEWKDELGRLNSLKMEIASRTIGAPPNGAEQDAVAELQEERVTLERKLADSIPEIGLKLRLLDLNWKKLVPQLGPSTVLVEFIRYADRNFSAVMCRNEKLNAPDRYCAFVLRSGDPAALTLLDLGEAAAIDQVIADFRACLIGEDTRGPKGTPTRFSLGDLAALIPTKVNRRRKELGKLGDAVVKAVVDPVRSYLESARTVVLVPDGQMLSIPFECLPEQQSSWLDRFEVIYLGSGRELLWQRAKDHAASAAELVLADPAYDLQSTGKDVAQPERQSRALRDVDWRFVPLNGTRKEGQAVGKILGVKPLMGSDATVSAVKQVHSPRVLHIATHGFFCDRKKDVAADEISGPSAIESLAALDNPMLRSGLALAGANSFLGHKAIPADAGCGILTAEDVSGLDLYNTELVVLSACDTGLGELVSGEGLFGFRRAFGVAGARMLVLSLWKVADDETQELMRIFYQHLQGGDNVQSALYKAKLKIRKRHSDPYFWAAFVCVGRQAGGNNRI